MGNLLGKYYICKIIFFMKSDIPTTSIVLDAKISIKSNKTYPVKLRITFDRNNRKYGTPYSLIKDFEKVMNEVPREPFISIKIKLNSIQKQAREIIKDLPYFFTFDAFFEQYEKLVNPPMSFRAFQTYIDQWRKSGSCRKRHCLYMCLKIY